MTVENLESLGLPEFRKAALLPEKVPTHDATQKLIHQDIVEDDSVLMICLLAKGHCRNALFALFWRLMVSWEVDAEAISRQPMA
jgi:hypothetical protein